MPIEIKRKKLRTANRTLYTYFPSIAGHAGCVSLGDFPTPVEPLVHDRGKRFGSTKLWVKREDLSSPVYGGNKIRTLEWLFAQAVESGYSEICSTGSYGSNHATATVLHASRVGLLSSVMLHPQPYSETARENFEVVLSKADEVNSVPHWAALPLIWLRKRLRDQRKNKSSYIMMPGGATPLGAIGYVSAALELAQQVDAGEMPLPQRIVLSVGSCCTSAGLLLGTEIATRLGIKKWGNEAPEIFAVRVTPWPVTAHRRIVLLAYRTSCYLYSMTRDPRVLVSRRKLSDRLRVDTDQLGVGYGYPTKSGLNAMVCFPDLKLDTTYSAKAAAALIHNKQNLHGCSLFWATKSSVPLPQPDNQRIVKAPNVMVAWLKRNNNAF